MKDYQAQLEELLETVAKHNASDIHFSVGRYPTLRIDGRLVPLDKYPIITTEEAEGLANVLMPKVRKEEFLTKKKLIFLITIRIKFVSGLMFFIKKDLFLLRLEFFRQK